MADLPTFEEFYEATHRGTSPFPWQSRLAARVVTQGWPDDIGIPTGLGKTACIDVAVWALAAQADRDPRQRNAPTRTWYVVNRRLLVDAAYDHGEELRRWMKDPESLCADWGAASSRHVEVVAAIAGALMRISQLGSEHGPLHVTRLRGGADLGARPPDPSQPAVVFATVPMFASRWLFRGYGSSVSMRPIDAALAGVDSLVLLDEAHLARPLARLAEPLKQCDIGDPGRLLCADRARPRFVALTATGEGGAPFDLDAADLAHPVVRKRFDAPKPTMLLSTEMKAVAGDLAIIAIDVLGAAAAPTSCLVFANTPQTARAAHKEALVLARKRGIDARCHLLTGRMREREAELMRRAILDPESGAPSGRHRDLRRERHLLVIATQTLEVGADVDFEHLVTETAGVRSLVQRFGRLNRLGDFPDATATILHPSNVSEWPVYGTEPQVVWERLQAAERVGDLNLTPSVISDVLGEPLDEPPPSAELLPHHLWDWAKTSVPRAPAAPQELFFDTLEQTARVSVLWRAYLPRDADEPVVLVPGVRGDEAVELPIAALRHDLERLDIGKVQRLASDARTVETVAVERIRPGDQVLLPTQVGLYDEYGWNPDSRSPVLDLSMLRTGLVLDEGAIGALFATPDEATGEVLVGGQRPASSLGAALATLKRSPADDEEEAAVAERRLGALSSLMGILDRREPPAGLTPAETEAWRQWRRAVWGRVEAGGLDRITWLGDGTPFVDLSLERTRMERAVVRSDAFDELSFVDAESPLLQAHLRAVGRSAAAIASRLGLPEDVVHAVGQAGMDHDLGKLEPRFQRWLDPDGHLTEPLAKSTTPRARRELTRVRSGWPRGGRHELISGRLVDSGLDVGPERDLVMHLVLAHHGHGRPTVPVVQDMFPTRVKAEVAGREVVAAGNLSLPDWEQPNRFRGMCEAYGYWGLTLLEAIVRQADHAASARSEVV